MRKKLDTRFPAARIKKIMQTDEDVGKIALAVPLLVSKALELFLQDLCDRTYEITLKKGAKTMNSLHLKQCVKTFNVFDFLKDIVSKVPDLGGSDVVGDEGSVPKRRKVSADVEDTESDDETKRSKMVVDGGNIVGSARGRGRGRGRGRKVVADDEDTDTDEEAKASAMGHEVGNVAGSGRGGRGRGRGRPRGRPRGSRTAGREMMSAPNEKYDDDDMDVVKHEERLNESFEMRDDATEVKGPNENISGGNSADVAARNFDLNVDLNENLDSATTSVDFPGLVPAPVPTPAPVPAESSSQFTPDMKHVEFLGWPLKGMESMAIDAEQLANLTRGIDEDEEDYDED